MFYRPTFSQLRAKMALRSSYSAPARSSPRRTPVRCRAGGSARSNCPPQALGNAPWGSSRSRRDAPTIESSLKYRISFPSEVVVELDAEGSEGHGQDLVGTDGEDQVHELLAVDVRRPASPRSGRSPCPPRCSYPRPAAWPFQRGPPRHVGTQSDPTDLVLPEAGVSGQDGVLGSTRSPDPARWPPEHQEHVGAGDRVEANRM